jgi:hypothetical protein
MPKNTLFTALFISELIKYHNQYMKIKVLVRSNVGDSIFHISLQKRRAAVFEIKDFWLNIRRSMVFLISLLRSE